MRADRIQSLARQLNLPISALSGCDLKLVADSVQSTRVLPHQPFESTAFEYCFPTPVAAKLAIAADLATPLAKLSDEDKAFIDQVLTDTLIRSEVFARVRSISATPNQERIMRVEVMEHYGLAQPIDQAGYYETAHHKQLIKDIRGAIHEGRLIAVCGVVGSGKTVTLRRLQQRLRRKIKLP